MCNMADIAANRVEANLSDQGALAEREVITAKISRKAADGWRQFCAANGVTLTALIEVAGLDLAKETSPPTVEARVKMVQRAREIDLERRSRRR